MSKKIWTVVSMIALVVIGLTIGFVVGRNSINATIKANVESVGSVTEEQVDSVETELDTLKEQSVEEAVREETVQEETAQEETLQEETAQKESAKEETLPEETVAEQTVSGKTDGSALRVEGTLLKDEDGNTVQLKGISTHGINWYPQYVNRDCFKEFHEVWGVNVIRLSMYTDGYNGYCNGADKEQLKQIIFDGVEYATREGMYVIIDWHILSDGNPHTNSDEARVFFDEVSKKYADYTNVFYEICNEPNGAVGWKEVKSYAEDIISVIRKNDKHGIILVGTPQWSQLVSEAAKDPITDYENIMYTLHFYADTHRDSLRQELESAVQNGLPVFVSEFSICEASGNGTNNIQEADKWMHLLDRYSISYVAWNMANKNESSSIFSPDCNKTSGFTEEDLSESGLWLKSVLSDDVYYNPEVVTCDKDALRVTALATDTWESGGNDNCNYSVTIENLSDETINGWEINLTFNKEIIDVQGWCGEFSFEGNTLHIKNADFNGQIQAQAKTRDIGFIITGPSGICVEEK